MGSEKERHIPEHVVFNILPRLPAKSLVRFKCVCKSWSSFINALNSDKHELVFSTVHSFHSVNLHPEATNNRLKSVKLNFPFGEALHKLISSCNGLLCILVEKERRTRLADLVLWNPLTEMYKTISISRVGLSENMFGFGYENFFGFGYDHSTNDYKIVRLIKDGNRTRFEIYSLNTNSWERGTLPWHISAFHSCKYSGTFVNGALYWRIDRTVDTEGPYEKILFNGSQVILRFDLVDDKFSLILPPNDVVSTLTTVQFDLCDFGGCLCVVHYHDKRKAHIDIWTRKEQNWIQLMRIPRLKKLDPRLYMAPVLFHESGQVLLHLKDLFYDCGKELFFLYSPKERTFRMLQIEGMEQFSFHKEITYKPSLTSLTRHREQDSIEVRPVETIAEKKVSKEKLEEDDDCRGFYPLFAWRCW